LHHIPHPHRTRSPAALPSACPKNQPWSAPKNQNTDSPIRFPATARALFLSTQSPAMADATNTNDELYPIAVLIDELKVWR
jgi:hypothetical protein